MPTFEWYTNASRDTVQFVRRNTKNKNDENTRIERKEIFKESKRNKVSCFNIYVGVSSTVEVGRW